VGLPRHAQRGRGVPLDLDMDRNIVACGLLHGLEIELLEAIPGLLSALKSAGVFFESGAHSGLQLVGGGPSVRVRGEHGEKQGAHGGTGRRGQRGRPLELGGDAQLEVGVLPQSLAQRHQPATAADVGA